ncbi:MAG: hypothetical protein COW16_12060, partial [Sphingomonadales bacterium CG12_big_fil_rev_8_21_14_0_65_65_10]
MLYRISGISAEGCIEFIRTDQPQPGLEKPVCDSHVGIEVSVLIPFYRDNPVPLLMALTEEIAAGELPVEVVLFDDGEPDPELNASVATAVDSLPAPARLLTARRNVGRAAGRNRLASAAIGDWQLFLDADMTVTDGFLKTWLGLICAYEFDAAFGGYTADPVQQK